ncbi:MAG: ParB/RepB/Spo0J family partition protein [Ignavibacteria bacterium]|nr:ParB/RepB/Spo0J family partition protein [Ignavibacteria bacterium]
MAEKKKNFGLGKGLGSLLGGNTIDDVTKEKIQNYLSEIFQEVEIAQIQFNPYQPRKNFDDKSLEELAESIKLNGVIQPITLRKIGNEYQLISGERRIRAALKAGLKKVPAFIIKVEEDYKLLEIALIENIQREDLNPIDIANGLKKLSEEFNLTQEEIANRVGKDRSTITNLIRLLKLPISVQDSLRKGEITIGHAKVLLSIGNDEMIKQIWKKIIQDKLSVRQTEILVSKFLNKTRDKSKTTKNKKENSNVVYIEQEISRVLGTKVKIHDKNNKGKIIIEYYNLDDFQRIIDNLLK